MLTANKTLRPHILFVDDEIDLAETYQDILEGFGYRVTVMGSAEDALNYTIAHLSSFDLAVTDYIMPGMNGFQLARQLRELRPDLPIIMMTAYARQFKPEHLGGLGLQGFLSKPINPTELCNALQRALAQPVACLNYSDAEEGSWQRSTQWVAGR
ncbi:MAG: response regulator [Acidobacteriota bacterium]|nr:response regulator [Acidobacteriota bacterium]